VSSSEILRGPTLHIGGAESGPLFGVIFGPAEPARGLAHICVFEGSFGYNGYFGTPRLGRRGPNLRPENGTSFGPPKCMQLFKFPLH
jgi:hypothetical protein